MEATGRESVHRSVPVLTVIEGSREDSRGRPNTFFYSG